jgi:hypothetical protein
MARIGPYHFRNNQWKEWSKREEKREVIDKRSRRPIILFWCQLLLLLQVLLVLVLRLFSLKQEEVQDAIQNGSAVSACMTQVVNTTMMQITAHSNLEAQEGQEYLNVKKLDENYKKRRRSIHSDFN